jgi:FixJ family two-component response regulator
MSAELTWKKEGSRHPALVSVVDDDPSMCEAIESLIRSIGLTAETFASAEEFLESDHLPETDCLIFDVRMPGMSGLELQRRLEAAVWRPPVIFMTAHEEEGARTQALNHGAVGFLIKPFTEADLLQALKRSLAERSIL